MSEVQPADIETTEAFAPMTFEQTRALVGEVLGQDVAERIEPTGRYVRTSDALFESDVPLLPIVKCWPNISIRPLPYRV